MPSADHEGRLESQIRDTGQMDQRVGHRENGRLP